MSDAGTEGLKIFAKHERDDQWIELEPEQVAELEPEMLLYLEQGDTVYHDGWEYKHG